MDKIIFGNNSLTTLVALTDEEQRRGLMHQSWPPPVMCFPYRNQAIRKFWMKDTISPLDIVFCNAGYVVSVIKGIPLSLNHVGPDFPVDLVVELPAGTAKRLEIMAGTKVKLVYGLSTLARKIELHLLKRA